MPATTLALPAQVAGPALLSPRRALHLAVRKDGDLVVDCGDVTELSPAAQALLVATSRAARRRGYRLHLLRLTTATVDALARTGLRHLLDGPSVAQVRPLVPAPRRAT